MFIATLEFGLRQGLRNDRHHQVLKSHQLGPRPMSNQRCFIDSCKSFGCIQKAKASAQTQYHGPRYFRSKHNDRGRYQPCINVSSCYQEYKMDQTRWEEMRKTQHVWISQKAKTAKIATVRINWAHSYCCKCCFKKLLWIFFSSFGKSVRIALDVTNLHFFPSNLSTRLKWQSAKKSQLQFPASLARSFQRISWLSWKCHLRTKGRSPGLSVVIRHSGTGTLTHSATMYCKWPFPSKVW